MRGWFYPAYYGLFALLFGALIYSIMQVFRSKESKNQQFFAGSLLAIEALLFFLSLLLQNYVAVLIVFAILAVGFGVTATFISKYHRGYLVVLSIASIIWVATTYWQLAFGM